MGILLLAALVLRAQPANPVFATYLGGGGNEVVGSVATDAAGNVYIAGRTDSPDFPLKNAIQPVSKSYSQIFIAKFSASGDLIYSTYYGGSANDLATGIAADAAGNVYVTGTLQSKDFPVVNAWQKSLGGGTDVLVMKLDPSGSVVYATYLGGRDNDLGMAIATDASGNAYVTGRVESPDFPVTAGALQSKPALYQPGARFVDAFVAKLDPSGKLVYSTFLGGTGDDIGWGIAVDRWGEAHVAGETSSLDFPTAGKALQPRPGRAVNIGQLSTDAFLAKLSADGSSLIFSTYFGSSVQDTARAIRLDGADNVYVTGLTLDARLPIRNGQQPYLGGDVYLRSADGGATFTPLRSGLQAAQVTTIAFDPHVAGLEYAGTLQGVFRSDDGGNTWTAAGLDDFNIQQLVTDSAGTLYAGTNFGGGLFRSSDRGATWTDLTAGFKGDPREAIFQSIAPDGAGNLYVVTGFGGISCCGSQPVYRVSENGAAWTFLGQGLPSTPEAVALDADSNVVTGTVAFDFFSFSGPGTHVPGSVFKRSSSGTWVSEGLDDDIHALVAGGGKLYAAGRSFYQSSDNGQTWLKTALPGSLTASQIALDPRNPATIYVLKGGLLRSDDGGQSFQTVTSQSFTALAVNPFDSSLHAGAGASADAYLIELDPTGALVYSTFVGGSSLDEGDGIAIDSAGITYVIGYRVPVGFTTFAPPMANGTTFVARVDAPGSAVDIGPSTSQTVLNMPSRAIAIGPGGALIAVMIATKPGLPVQNAAQSDLRGDTDVYLVKWFP